MEGSRNRGQFPWVKLKAWVMTKSESEAMGLIKFSFYILTCHKYCYNQARLVFCIVRVCQLRIYEKIKFMRTEKSISREEMAEKLGLSVNGYANIERGETDVQMSRIQQIADVLDVDLMELLSFGERNVVCFTGNENHFLTNFNNISHDSTESIDLKNDLEKAHLIIEAKNAEVAYLKEIIELMKKAQGAD